MMALPARTRGGAARHAVLLTTTILTHARAGLPDEVLGQHIVAHPALDPAARLALFRCCHALARMVLLHAPSSKRVTHKVSSISCGAWSATLARLFRAKWRPLPACLDLELCVESSVQPWATDEPPHLPMPPPSAVTQHISHLHFHQVRLGVPLLAAWQLHDPARWPHLQHLTVTNAVLQLLSPTDQPLQPIPGLQSFTMKQLVGQCEVVRRLASNATHARLEGTSHVVGLGSRTSVVDCVTHLQRLTHLRLDGHAGSELLEALLQHPTLEHVAVDSLYVYEDLSQQPCRWRTLTMAQGLGFREAALLPLAGLERLTIKGSVGRAIYLNEPCVAGVAALQRLHGEGRLALLPATDAYTADLWGLLLGDELFDLSWAGEFTPALLRLVVEAGQGVNTLVFYSTVLPLSVLRGEVVPLPGRQGAGIQTLCVDLSGAPNDQWCAGLLGALPACITRIQVRVVNTDVRDLAVLVRGGVEGLRDPLTLTLLHEGEITAEQEAELRQLAAGSAAGQPQQGSLLALEVVRTR